MHHGIHIDNLDRVAVSHDGYEWRELTILGFHPRDRKIKWFAGFNVVQKHYDVLETVESAVLIDSKIVEQSPSVPVRNASTIFRVRKSDEVKRLRRRNRSLQRHHACERPAIVDVHDIIRLNGRAE